MTKLGDYLTVGEAAELLGVSPWTLRYWDRTGKLKPTRHPLSGYRLYRREQLDEILRLAAGGGDLQGPAAVAPITPDPGRPAVPPQQHERGHDDHTDP
jgi:MerR family transcriptional regulator, copper efflux regulator